MTSTAATAATPAGTLVPALTGVVPPVCTPLTPDFEVDVTSLLRLVDFQLAGGVDGLFVLGSSSEVAFLPDAHRAVVVDRVLRHVAGQVPVLVGAIDMTTLRVLDHARRAARAGCSGIVVTAPFYTRTHPAEIELHLRRVAEQCEAPLYAYDLPVSVHSNLDHDMLLRLAAEGLLAGLKDSTGDDAGLRDLIVARDDAGLTGFSVLTGSELTVDNALRMGADGVVPGLGNVDPHGYAALHAHARAGDWEQAGREQERLLRLMRIVRAAPASRMGRGSSALGAFKTALRLRGVIEHAVTAPPQIPLDDTETDYVRRILIAAGLL
ncbi:4-hydroxy-tetrahydrodipicolinate synthase [Actinoplanes octamycinicus]|uniref:4-hydroxy-tetrahydrodipicolinate synthase n=1 Tax=Actinoplanes octamycinicus TaxID=135948 RepID=A0A7W7M9L0_9ACTN|nr:dihydrodipicolinate synthase family protein [Actinoplanes octamycinicus]MBB4742128.1 4-hydroxy-tetrahydrodipicolinate synthase [Actinoplanes octamycinicus]GIE60026.1 dihydrodipicolinate synthase family protein [Actinoplanes octamycinicus]